MILKILPALLGLKAAGGLPLLVGGFVRDRLLLGIDSKDIDVEVYGLSRDDIVNVLSQYGNPQLVGESFGVIKMRIGGDEFDFSLPRREVKSGKGHRGFDVEFDPWMQPKDACSRRDFTFNAMLFDPFKNEMLDFFKGQLDLRDRLIRHVSYEHFGEDPLRALRAFQFAGRFNMALDRDTALLICRMVANGEMDELPAERIWAEWEKWALKSKKPSAGLLVLKETAMLRMFPELQALDGLEQDADHHPEGDAFQHTMCAVDAACEIADREQLDDDMRLVLMLAAVCHDFGKASTTKRDEKGKLITHGHDKAGVAPTEAFLRRMLAPGWVVDHVLPLVRNHMVFRFRGDFKLRTYRRLALKMKPSNLRMLALLMEADGAARPPKPREDPFPELLTWAEELKVVDDAPKPILMGRHLLQLGMKGGPLVGEIIRMSFEAQLDGEFYDEDGAVAWAKDFVGVKSDAKGNLMLVREDKA
jgi:tRNA nucleotidyltransferase (CCA-adding enzyme)